MNLTSKLLMVIFLFSFSINSDAARKKKSSEPKPVSVKSLDGLQKLIKVVTANALDDCVQYRLDVAEKFHLDQDKFDSCKEVSAWTARKKIKEFFKSSISHFEIDLKEIGAENWEDEVKDLIGKDRYLSCSPWDVVLIRKDYKYRLRFLMINLDG